MSIPVVCNCANNKCGMCYGKANMAYIHSVMAGETKVTDCPGYIAPGSDPYEGEPQGDKKMGPGGTKGA